MDDYSHDPPPSPTLQDIPATLRDIDRWCRWHQDRHPKTGEPTKRPEGSVLDPDIQKPFAAVASAPVTASEGIGFVFTKGVDVAEGRIFGLDIDGCRCPASGAIEPWAQELLRAFQSSYTEVTPSGTGLRQWVIVRNPPESGGKIRIPFPAPHNVRKTPEVQLFGAGGGQYVTVTGLHLEGTSSDLLVVEDMEWLGSRYGFRPDALPDVTVPTAPGTPPDGAEIRAKVCQTESGAELLEGDWNRLGYPSASEAWWDLVQMTLAAARGHGAAAAEFLLSETPWGHGLVDSREPDRYARRAWVLKDIARVAGKTHAANVAEAFGDFDFEAWRPPATGRPEPPGGLLMPAGEFLAQPSDVPFLVYGLLPKVGLAQFYGDPSCGKTPFALSLAIHVAMGSESWFGHDLDTPGPVVYMIGEDPTGIRERLRAELGKVEGAAERVADSFFVTRRPGRLIEPEDAAAWVRAVQETLEGMPPALLVVDTQSRNFGPGNENSTEDMAAYIDNLQAMADRLQCLVLLVHHTGHQAKDRGRGSSTLPAAVDAQYEVRRDGTKVTATSKKAKNWKEPAPLEGTLEPVTLGTDRKGREVTAITLREGQDDDHTVAFDDETLDGLKDVLNYVLDSMGDPFSHGDLGEELGMTRSTARRKVARCLELKLIEEDPNASTRKYRKSYVLTPQGFRCV